MLHTILSWAATAPSEVLAGAQGLLQQCAQLAKHDSPSVRQALCDGASLLTQPHVLLALYPPATLAADSSEGDQAVLAQSAGQRLLQVCPST